MQQLKRGKKRTEDGIRKKSEKNNVWLLPAITQICKAAPTQEIQVHPLSFAKHNQVFMLLTWSPCTRSTMSRKLVVSDLLNLQYYEEHCSEQVSNTQPCHLRWSWSENSVLNHWANRHSQKWEEKISILMMKMYLSQTRAWSPEICTSLVKARLV